jgi:hypothetical protein
MELTAVAALAEERGDDLAGGVVVLDEEDAEGPAREDLVPPHYRPPRCRGGRRRAGGIPASSSVSTSGGRGGVGVRRHSIGGGRASGRGAAGQQRASEGWEKYLQYFFPRWAPRQRRGGETGQTSGRGTRTRGVEMARQQILCSSLSLSLHSPRVLFETELK